MTTNLALWNRLDPRNSQVKCDGDNTNDPEGLAVVGFQVSEDDSEDNPTKIACSTCDARDNTVCKGMDVRDEREVSTVASLEEECHASDETEHSRVRLGVKNTNGDLKAATDDAERVQ